MAILLTSSRPFYSIMNTNTSGGRVLNILHFWQMDAKPEFLVRLDPTALAAWMPNKPGSPQHVFAGDGEAILCASTKLASHFGFGVLDKPYKYELHGRSRLMLGWP